MIEFQERFHLLYSYTPSQRQRVTRWFIHYLLDGQTYHNTHLKINLLRYN